MSWLGDMRVPPLASRAQASRRPVICEALSRLSLSAARRGDTRKLVKLPVNDSSNRLTTARSSGAVASSITTFRVELAMQFGPGVSPEVKPVGEAPAANPLGALAVSSSWPDYARESPWLDVDVTPDLNVVTGLGRLQQLEAHENSGVSRGTRKAYCCQEQGE